MFSAGKTFRPAFSGAGLFRSWRREIFFRRRLFFEKIRKPFGRLPAGLVFSETGPRSRRGFRRDIFQAF
jgi:hypothetical protein